MMSDMGVLYKEDSRGKGVQLLGGYKEQLMCLRGALVAMSGVTGLSMEEILADVVMMDKEEGIHNIKRMDVIFRFSQGNTHIKTLNSAQMKGVQKVLGMRIKDGNVQYADDFLIKQS